MTTQPKKGRSSVVGPESRIMAKFGHLQMVVQVADEESRYHGDESGKDICLYIRSGRGAILMNLTSFTRDELAAIGTIMATAIDLAKDVCDTRDREALEREEAGDDSGEYIWRLYRRVPEILVRNGTVYKYDPELQLRSSWSDDLDRVSVREVQRLSDVARPRRALLDGYGQESGDGSKDAGT